MDAKEVLPEITHYLRESERVERFKTGTREIDPETAKYLANIIREMMGSAP